MAFVYCHCGSRTGRLCANCKKAEHTSQRSVRNYGAFGCAAVMRGKKWKDRVVMCSDHHPVLADCDMCHTREVAIDAGYPKYPQTWHEVKGFLATKANEQPKPLSVCDNCFHTMRVGIDWALENAGESIIVSVACAFAFQLGQYADSFPGSGGSRWDLIQRRMSPDFTVTTFGDFDHREWTAEQRFLSPVFSDTPPANGLGIDVAIIDEGD